ncbi:MAG: DUF2029 domain-containing protein [Pseudomonadales bacterium]|nr:DUF2029 domain-containing protein [Pseudomonadales bacterium]
MNARSVSAAQKLLLCLLMLVCLLAAISFGVRVASEYRGGLPVDMLIFRKAALDFWQTGELYDRPENVPHEKYIEHPYEPGAPIYKFPPAFQLALAPWVKNNAVKPGTLFAWLRSIMIVLYALSVFLMLNYFYRMYFSRKAAGAYSGLWAARYFILPAFIGACIFYPFFNAYQALVAEIPLLFLFLLFFLLMDKRPSMAGFFLAYSSLIKIYPAFIGLVLLYTKNRRAIISSIVSGLLIAGFCFYYFGFTENMFYLQEILPALLKEPVIVENKNLSLESWLVFHGFREQITGSVFQSVRLLALLYLAWQFYCLSTVKANRAVVFSLTLSVLLLCLPNYWVQYQLFLLFPLFHLLAVSVSVNNPRLTSMVLVCFVCFVPDVSWYGKLASLSPSLQQVPVEQLARLAIENGQAWLFWHYSKPAWVIYCIVEVRPFIPILILILLGLHRDDLSPRDDKTEVQAIH